MVNYSEMFEYRDGKLFWKVTAKGPKPDHGQAGSLWTHKKTPPRWKVKICNKAVYRARIVWIMHNGVIPDKFEVDHINGNQLDDRIENLRLATKGQNCYNRGRRSDNISGYKGVSWSNKQGRWRARITVGTICKHIGYFGTKEQAHEAYCKAANDLHGEFCRTR